MEHSTVEESNQIHPMPTYYKNWSRYVPPTSEAKQPQAELTTVEAKQLSTIEEQRPPTELTAVEEQKLSTNETHNQIWVCCNDWTIRKFQSGVLDTTSTQQNDIHQATELAIEEQQQPKHHKDGNRYTPPTAEEKQSQAELTAMEEQKLSTSEGHNQTLVYCNDWTINKFKPRVLDTTFTYQNHNNQITTQPNDTRTIDEIADEILNTPKTVKVRKKKRVPLNKRRAKYKVGQEVYDRVKKQFGRVVTVGVDKPQGYSIVQITDDPGQSDKVSRWESLESNLEIRQEDDGSVPMEFMTYIHNLYGHLNMNALKKLYKLKVTLGDRKCVPCIRAKMKRKGFKKSYSGPTRATSKLQRVHTDIVGPIKVKGYGGKRYVITFIDEFTRKAQVYTIKKKSDSSLALNTYIAQFGTPRMIVADAGGEYMGQRFTKMRLQNNIGIKYSSPHSHALHGIAERFNRTICERASAMMFRHNTPDYLWPFAVTAATYLYNRVPHSALDSGTPESNWQGREIDMSNIRTFGCRTYTLRDQDAKAKTPHFQDKTMQGILVGYAEHYSYGTYEIYNITTRRTHHSQNVTFDEHKGYLDTPDDPRKKHSTLQPTRRHFWHNDKRWDDGSNFLDAGDLEEHVLVPSPSLDPLPNIPNQTDADSNTASEAGDVDRQGSDTEVEQQEPQDTPVTTTPTIPRRSTRNRKQTKFFICEAPEIYAKEQHLRKGARTTTTPTERLEEGPTQSTVEIEEISEEDSTPLFNTRSTVEIEEIQEDEDPTPMIVPNPQATEQSNREESETQATEHERTEEEAPTEVYTAYHLKYIPDNLCQEIQSFQFSEMARRIGRLRRAVQRDYTQERQNGRLPTAPLNVKLAKKDKLYGSKWLAAMELELCQLSDKKTFDTTPASCHKKGTPIRTKWVFAVKQKRFKARLVVLGFLQRKKLHQDNFSPVVCKDTTRILFSYAARMGFKLRQWDVSNAFLYAICHDLVFITIPEEFGLLNLDIGNINKIRLHKMLYGMVDSPIRWNEELDDKLTAYGLYRSTTDPGHYYNNFTGLHLVTHVDDGVYAGPDKEMRKFEKYLKGHFELDPAPVDVFCGITVVQDDQGIFIHQIPYIEDMTREYITDNIGKMGDGPPFRTFRTPMEIKLKLQLEDIPGEDGPEEIPFRELQGKLQWIACSTRPDISFAVKELAKCGSKYTRTTYKYAQRILMYLYTTRYHCLQYVSTGDRKHWWDHKSEWKGVTGTFSDASHAGPENQRRSTGGYITIVNGTPVAWSSKTQRRVSLSSCESEFKQLSRAISHAVKMQETLHNFNMKSPHEPMDVFTDNQPALKNMQRPAGSSSKTQHVEKYLYFVQDYLGKEVQLHYLETGRMLADILTKSLSGDTHEKLRNYLLKELKPVENKWLQEKYAKVKGSNNS